MPCAPLSSAGVKKALLSAWRAAIVANTCLKRSPAAAAARDFYTQREREVYADCTQRSRVFFAERRSDRLSSALRTPSIGRSGVEGALPSTIPPVSTSTTTMSVKVPPTSVVMRNFEAGPTGLYIDFKI